MAKAPIDLYGCLWPAGSNPLKIEFACITRNGQWTEPNGKVCGLGLFHHYKMAQRYLWPTLDHHRWSDLILKAILENRITMVLGPKDSSKTFTSAAYALTDYFCFPQTTLTLVSSTDIRGLELRVWGAIKDLFNQAKERHPWVPGNCIESKHGIFTDALTNDGDIRDTRRAIICIPCVGSQGEWTGGVQKFCGVKQKRRRLIADELGFMRASYITSVEHLDKGDFKLVGLANPIGQGDPADKISEPVGGWGTEPESEKTETWPNRWGGITINLDGRDTPNNDEPKNRFPYLISTEDVERTAQRRGKDSMEFWTQVVGKRRAGLNAKRVLTRQMCHNFGAFAPVIWMGTGTTKIYAIDASYGGDRCVAGGAEFGEDINHRQVINFWTPKEIQINVDTKRDGEAEDQIAKFVRSDCERNEVPASNVGYDSTGRGSLGTSFGRLWSTAVNPVEFGGAPTARPVFKGLFILDEETGAKRLKRCDEEYSKRVTEYWFSVRHLVEARQCRSLPEICAEEFGMREWYLVKGNKIEIETKEDTKDRMGMSPDYADWAVIIVEMARRLGFTIEGLVDETAETEDLSWLEDMQTKHRAFLRKTELSYR